MARWTSVLLTLVVAAALAAQGDARARAMDLMRQKKYEEALEAYKKILQAEPEDTNSLYNAACAAARLGRKEEALDYLKRAVDAGWGDFGHMKRDPDLESLRGEEAFKRLLAGRVEALKKAMEKRLKKWKERLGADYGLIEDRERKLLVLSNLPEASRKRLASALKDYYDAFHKEFFENVPDYQILVIIPKTAAEYRGKCGGRTGAAGFYRHDVRTLFVNIETGGGTMIHEFTHAMHYGDMEARGQRHPIWIVEAFGTMFEQCTIRDGRPVGLLNWRLPIIRRAIEKGEHIPWRDFMTKSSRHFARATSLSYAETRYIFYWLQEKGLMAKFYKKYVENYDDDPTGVKTFEAIVGKSLEEAEPEWRGFVKKLKREGADRPRLGVYLDESEDAVKVTKVAPDSGAEQAGVKPEDVILEIEGKEVKSVRDLRAGLSGKKRGDRVRVKVKRGEETLELEVTLK